MESGKTVLITGASSGIGLETALYFHQQGWNVIATMRHPDRRRTPLHDKGLPHIVHLDVMEPDSIDAAIRNGLDRFGKIDVLVNNAGYTVYGPFEATTQAQIEREFNTNLFGLMAVTRAFLPVFQRQGGGVVVNVSSMGGRIGFPLYSIYNSTKWAVEGFSEALRFEVEPLNIRIKLIEPGVIKTDFYDRSLDRADTSAYPGIYDDILRRAQKLLNSSTAQNGTDPWAVAQAIFRAATDGSSRLRYPVGSDAQLVAFIRWLLPERLFFKVLEKNVLG